MKFYEWNREKNDKLKKERGISFEEVVIKIINGGLLDIISNPSRNYPNQKVYVIKINNYIYYIPHIEDNEKIFLKTIIPSRKATKKYLNK
jgi:uncharacterized DUF497 family protein